MSLNRSCKKRTHKMMQVERAVGNDAETNTYRVPATARKHTCIQFSNELTIPPIPPPRYLRPLCPLRIRMQNSNKRESVRRMQLRCVFQFNDAAISCINLICSAQFYVSEGCFHAACTRTRTTNKFHIIFLFFFLSRGSFSTTNILSTITGGNFHVASFD